MRETQHAVIVAHLTGLDPNAAALRITATLDGSKVAAPILYSPAVDDLSLLLPDGLGGAVRIDATALDANDSGIARGGAATRVTGNGQWPIAITLSPDQGDRTLLLDRFDDGDPATNTAAGAVGGGFTAVGYDPFGNYVGAHATESGGLITVGGPATMSALQSNDGFDPTGTTLTAVVAMRPSGTSADGGANGMSAGWTRADRMPCCDDYAYADLSTKLVALDIGTTTTFSPDGRYLRVAAGSTTPGRLFDADASTHDLTITLHFGVTEWRLDESGPGLEIHQRGGYRPGHGIPDVRAVAGGAMRPFVGVGREGFFGSFRSVHVVGPPPGVVP